MIFSATLLSHRIKVEPVSGDGEQSDAGQTMIRFAIKGGLAASAIYYTRNEGVWGNNQTTTKLYEKVSHELQPHLAKLKKQVPLEIPLLPSKGEVCYLVNHYYNNAVKESIKFINMLPCHVGRGIKYTKDGITKLLEAPPAVKETPAVLAPQAKSAPVNA